MSRILINSFGGISPVTPARFLENHQAQVALNADAFYGTLQSLKDAAEDDGGYFAEDYNDADYAEATDVNLLSGVTANSIYLFGTQVASRIWFHWNTDVDVVRGFIAGDTLERTFFSGGGGGRPQATDSVLNPGPAPYPDASFDLGIPAPTTAPTTATTGTASANAVPETRVYTYTWVNSWGDESAPYSLDPMPASSIIDVSDGEAVDVTLPTTVSGNIDIDFKRLYRSVLATGGEVVFLFVAEIVLATSVYNDDVDGDDLGEVCPSLTWLPPVDDLIGLTGLPGGVLAGFDGRDLYFSDPYHPYAWPIEYMQTIEANIVGLGSSDTTLFVLTDGRPVILQGSHPSSMTAVFPDIHQACVSKRSIVEIMGSVYYASPDGLIRISTGGSDIVTDSFMTKEQWKELEPDTIHAYVDERRYVAFFQSGIYGNGGFVIDIKRGVFILHNIYVEAGFYSLEDDALFVAQSNFIKRWNSGDNLTYNWKSKIFTTREPVAFSSLRLDAEGSGVEVKLHRDGAQIFNKVVTPRKLEKLPSGKGKDWEIELTGTEEVFSVAIAEASAELGDA